MLLMLSRGNQFGQVHASQREYVLGNLIAKNKGYYNERETLSFTCMAETK